MQGSAGGPRIAAAGEREGEVTLNHPVARLSLCRAFECTGRVAIPAEVAQSVSLEQASADDVRRRGIGCWGDFAIVDPRRRLAPVKDLRLGGAVTEVHRTDYAGCSDE